MIERFIAIDIVGQISRARWISPFLASSVAAYVFVDSVIASARGSAAMPNIWDGLFCVFASDKTIFYLLTPLWLFLVGDLIAESAIHEAQMMRIGSRRAWWAGKVAVLAALALCYLAALVAVVLAVSSFVLPWQGKWSAWTAQDPSRLALPEPALGLPPALALALLCGLLLLGWVMLGLVVLVASLVSKRAIGGLAAGFGVMLAGLLAQRAALPAAIGWALPGNHLIFASHTFGKAAGSYPTLGISYGYWVISIAALALIGLRLSAKRDFLRQL